VGWTTSRVAPYPDAVAVRVAKLGWVAAAWIGE
jgi:hypothetical protein